MAATQFTPVLRHSTGVAGRFPWPPGTGFAIGHITLGEIDAVQLSTFEKVWTALEGGVDNKGVAFYKPVEVPTGYNILCHYVQRNSTPQVGWVLAIKESGIHPSPTPPSSSSSASPPLKSNSSVGASEDTFNRFAGVTLAPTESAGSIHRDEAPNDNVDKSSLNLAVSSVASSPALKIPIDFRLIWKSSTWAGKQNGNVWVWLPIAPEGYSVLGFIVTKTEEKPALTEVVCVRNNLTEALAVDSKIFGTSHDEFVFPFSVWSTRPVVRGVSGTSVNVGSFYCARSDDPESTLSITCIKNVEFKLDAMPTMEQVASIQEYYGPTLVFHPTEQFLPCSVAWFFDAGAMLHSKDSTVPPMRILSDGSNLPQGGTNDGSFWIDLPGDGMKDSVKKGNLESATVLIHVKPVYGGTHTDLASWVFYAFNGPSIAKVGKLNIPLGHLGEHVSDWEHYTLRVSNFTGELEAVYFSQHSKGEWIRIYDLEYNSANKPLVYVAKSGHPCYPHPGDHLQGDERRGIGLRNDTALSSVLLDSRNKYQIISAEYMHQRGDADAPQEPAWLQYMREWGPKVEYDRKKYLDKLLSLLPSKLRESLEDVIDTLPDEVMGQEGPTGPKEKNMWSGDERS